MECGCSRLYIRTLYSNLFLATVINIKYNEVLHYIWELIILLSIVNLFLAIYFLKSQPYFLLVVLHYYFFKSQLNMTSDNLFYHTCCHAAMIFIWYPDNKRLIRSFYARNDWMNCPYVMCLGNKIGLADMNHRTHQNWLRITSVCLWFQT